MASYIKSTNISHDLSLFTLCNPRYKKIKYISVFSIGVLSIWVLLFNIISQNMIIKIFKLVFRNIFPKPEKLTQLGLQNKSISIVCTFQGKEMICTFIQKSNASGYSIIRKNHFKNHAKDILPTFRLTSYVNRLNIV